MSWEEYKKKRNKQENKTTISNNNSETSSWEQYKQKREQARTESKIRTKMNNVFVNSANNEQQENISNQKLLLPLLNKGQTININNNSINNFANMSSGQRVAMIKSMTNNQKDFNKLNQEVIQYQQEKQAEEKANKINQDMSNGKYGSAIGHILSGVPQKALDSTTTTFASLNSLVAPNKINATMADENELLKTNRVLTSKYENTTNKIDNDIVKTASNISGTIGGMLPSIASNIAMPGSGAIVQGVNVGADAYQDTLNEDASNKLQATTTGIAKGTVSGLIERITGGNLIGKGSLDDVSSNFIANKFKGKAGQWFASKAYEMIGEIGEENLENQAGYIIDKIINGKDITAKEWWNEATETTKNTFLTTVVLNLLGLGGNTYNEVKDINSQKYLKEAKEIIKNENISNNTANLQQNTINNNDNLQTQQTNQEQNKIAQNGLSEQIDIANNQETLYNNNESESDIGGEQRGNTNGIQTSTLGSQEENAFSIDRYKQEETTIRNQGEVNYTDNDKNFATKMQNKYNKKTFIFDDTNTSYGGGLSYIDNDTIMFGRNALDNYGYDFLEGHEILEDINKNYKDIGQKTLDNLKQKLQDDEGFGDVFLKYIADMNEDVYQYYINKPELIAKEIIGDLNGLRNANIEYSTLENYKALNPQLVKEIQDEVLNLENIIYNKDNQSSFSMQNNIPKTMQEVGLPIKKKLNPTEIANLTIEDANTTPILPQKNYTKGNKQSSFFRNVIEDAQFLNKDLRQEMSRDENIRYYKGITNAETLEKAYTDLQNGGQQETMRWFNKENKDISAEDIAKGWILLKQYQDKGDHQSAVEVAKKMRNMGTKAGQAVQAYNILSRLTPEGMFYYAQSELSEAYNKMAEGKSKEWIDDNRGKFDLTPEETQIIKEKMESIQGVEDERTKKIALAEIQKIITDKIPPTASQSVKSWMRISMLFNPKTQVRNVAGNAVILPVNMTSDFIASGIDRVISKKTGVRTTGNINLKNYAKGFGKGLYESYDDFRKGINTRNIEGNRFEVTEGKNFKDKGIGKALNRVDNMLSFMLDAGDRGFYEATFVNSINNQLVLNNTTEVTADMIDIATEEALQRTWQDNNTYTNAVLKIRKLLNFNKGYGLGDILIPFAKTPANLTKAIVDYSPVGLTKTLAVDARKFNNSLKNGQYTPQLQHKFVQDLGKGMAGSFLYVLGYALAKAGVITGEADDDKDVKNFMKNSLGINSYSIKIGDKSFAYDWAQPVATPFAIMANFEKYNKENPDASAIDKAINSINIGSEQLLQQSFMESINTVLNGNGTFVENLGQSVLELPSRAVPTLSKQVADMVDETQRTSFEYKKPVESAINSVKAKIPFVSRTLPISIDTLGNEIQKYGGDNNLWNVMFNPANMNKGQLSQAGEEIYNVYMETGDATILPRTAPYYIDSKGERKTMTSTQRSEFQKITGKYVENAINGLLNNKDYKKLSDDKKAELINEIVSDSYSKAKYDILNIDSEQYEKLRKTLKSVSATSYYDYKSKTEGTKKDSEKLEVLVDANYAKKEKQTLYENYIKSKTDEKYDILKTINNFNIESYLEYKLASSNEEFKADRKDDGTLSGKTISGSAKNKKFNYISNMENTPYMQKAILFGLESTPDKSDKAKIVNYITSLSGKNNKEKLKMLDQFSWITIYKDGSFKY